MEYNQRQKRYNIIESQKIFWSFLDSNIINNLIHLFDDTDPSPDKISKYVENERKIRGLDYETIVGKVYREDDLGYNLLLEIIKDNKRFLHISFHITPNSFNINKYGPIHIYKNTYKEGHMVTKKKRYSLIKVSIPDDKPNSLVFSIPDGYKTEGVNINEKHIEEEMDIIISVLNNIFDEKHEYYIGNKDKIVHIHDLANTIQKNINKSTNVTRKNKGVTMYPALTNRKPYHLLKKIIRKTYKLPKRTTSSKVKPRNNQP